MSYTVRYSGTTEQRMIKVLKDARYYLGIKLFNKIIATLQGETKKHGYKSIIKNYQFMLSFVGVQGAPARAMLIYSLANNDHYLKQTNKTLK